ncbi:purine-nucleoside phosphorylase [Bacteroidales bacterium OttesenSCG-928-K03]|nr:purine-nucleoside phosphorylase [Bacteroidales bacterium OttesenSCG-928-L14]MDL2240327.1 purine-nucleoside phosphorylase [Bacteroidales bacterium OttesenSCG-928-K22]MDL2243157.1 purine-nucleoside phosphorylase [Bacteroidales bacterium OttesenSCG-928-K03]
MSTFQKSVDYIKTKIKVNPKVAIILGSGLHRLAESIENPITIPYKDIPEFPVSTAPGHKGNLIFGKISGVDVVVMQGRFHFYEGYPMSVVTYPIRVFSLLGVEYLFVTNAAGGINKSFGVGDVMLINDHISLTQNPLIGKNLEEFGERFPDMTVPYDKELRVLALKIAKEQNIELKQGVYIGVTGPSFETIAEVNFFRLIGADAVGMSTVPEVIVARQCSMKVFGMSMITNAAAMEDASILNDGEDVLYQADKEAGKMEIIVKEILKKI